MTGFDTVLNNLIRDTWTVSIPGFLPEIVLAATIVVMLLVRLFRWGQRVNVAIVAMVGTLAALGAAFSYYQYASHPGPIFSGLLVSDDFSIFFRIFLLVAGALVIWLTRISGIPDREDSPDFYTLLLGALIGMSLMASANHLLMIFIGVEMASVPSYAMAGFLKGRRQSSEASLKYVVYGAGASGVMLYGLSLLMGLFGTARLPDLAGRIAEMMRVSNGLDSQMLIVLLAVLMVFVGIAFKLAAVPFHFWCPDVFEGAATEVAAFLSVASKGAALGLLVRFVVAIAYQFGMLEPLADVRLYLGAFLAVLGAITATFGNLAAYAQTNLKRLLAYSTIAHAGYMIMPVAAALRMLDSPHEVGMTPVDGAQRCLEAVIFYLAIYLFMNLGAFAVVAFIRNEIRSEDLRDYSGLWRRYPGLTVCMAIFLLSLTGVPPLAGFVAKFRIFVVLYDAKLYWLLVVGLLNTLFAAFYYLNALRVMIFQPGPDEVTGPQLTLFSRAGAYALAVAAPVLVLGVLWDGLNLWAGHVARAVFLSH